MPFFSYKATTIDGTVIEGALEASDESSAVEKIKDSGLIPLKISVQAEGLKKRFSLRSSKGDLVTFTTELSSLLSAGLPLDRSLNILSEISESSEMKETIQSILRLIREGSSFSEALQRYPRVFPRIYVNMVRAGEAGGVLDVVLDKLNEFLESMKELREHIFSAMIYPTILVITGGASIAVLLTFVLPRFSVIFSELGRSLPLPTQVLLIVSDAIRSYWWVLSLLIISVWVGFKGYIRSDKGRYSWDYLKMKLLGEIIKKIETARFCRTLGTLLQSGVPLLQALNNAKEVVSNQVIASKIDIIAKGAKEGKGISNPLNEIRIFPPLALSMIKVGEETGQLETMLLKVAQTYERSLRVAIKRFVSFLEPALILGMGIIIGFIVISILMAIFSIVELPF